MTRPSDYELMFAAWQRPTCSATTKPQEGTMKMFRQGDVLIRQINEIPNDLVPVPKDQGRVILAYGEVTGHAHAVIGPVEFLAADLQEMNERFLRVEQEAQVVHEEHDTIVLPPGNYEVVRQREYAPEAPVWVAD